MPRTTLSERGRKPSQCFRRYVIAAVGAASVGVTLSPRVLGGQVITWVAVPPVAQSTLPNPTPTFTVQTPAACTTDGSTLQLIPDGSFVRQKKDISDPGTPFDIDVWSGDVVGHCDISVWGQYDHTDYRKVV